MKCVICRQGTTRKGRATVTLTRDVMALVVRGVPARVCQNCCEQYVGEATTARLLRTAEYSSG